MKPPKADTVRVPGLLDQYRQQRRAWLAQADELVRMRDEVRLAAEHEALEIVTAARRDVRRIIVEARRELLVLTAQLHAAVEATDDPRLGGRTLAPLLADPEDRSRFDAATGDPLDHTRDIVLSARKEVRSVLGEARAEIEALTSEAPAALGAVGAAPDGAIDTDTGATPPSAQRGPEPGGTTTGGSRVADHGDEGLVDEGPVHELRLDADLTALDFQSRDLPIPTLAGILGGTDARAGTHKPATDREQELTGGGPLDGPVFDPPSLPPYGTPRLSELRNLLREPLFDDRPHTHAFDVEATDLSAAGPRPAPTAEAPDEYAAPPAAPTPSLAADPSTMQEGASETTFDAQEFTPPARLFMSDETRGRGQGRSARMFVGLFAATGALALLATAWWVFARNSAEPLSAATPPVIESPADAVPAPADATRSAASAKPPESLSLTIEARRASWIRTLVDGKDEAGRIYAAGETRHIEGAHTVSIRAGDAGAVFVSVDGAPAQPLGPNGGPATKQFARASAGEGEAPAVNAAPLSSPPESATPPPASTPAVAAPIAQATARRPDAPTPAGATPQTSAAATNEAGPAIDNTSAGRPDLVQAGQQWLDAYQRRDRDAMASSGTENITVSDERSVTERFPAWQSSVRRDLDQVELELTGDTALLTARMTERTDGAQTAQHISRVSQIWVRRSGRWRLADVRIIGEARLNQIVR